MSNQPPISPIDSLVDLACRDGVDVRPTLLRVITDLYVQKPAHSDNETKQYVELALGLIDAVDDATRAVVAATLSHYPGAPDAVLGKLNAAGSASRASLALPPVAFGEDIRPQPPASEPAAEASDDLIEVFFSADRDARRLILLNLDVVADGDPRLTVSADVVGQLEAAALKRHQADFARLLAQVLRIRRELADRIAQDPSGEPIVIAAKAMGIQAAVLQRILLCLNPAIGMSVERVFDLAVLYDEISAAAASHMVSIWRELAPAIVARSRHEPVYQDDARTVRRPVAREARRGDARDTGAAQKAAR
ncbi:MAG: DUF2336 domain-containing protein [Pseudolabrys sp.]|nr:DUF2336 domain-containing protein [Pseudolabrys sp.]